MTAMLVSKIVATLGGLTIAVGAGLAWLPAGIMCAGGVIVIVGLLFIEERPGRP